MSLTLYYHPLASFCHKVLIALYENGTEFEKRLINLGDEADRTELKAIWPFGKFPVIRDHVRKRDVAESTLIIEYLDHYLAGDQPLIPVDWESALQVRLWDRVCDNYLQAPMQQIVSDRLRNANGDLSSERSTLLTAYEMIEQSAATRTWIAGPSFSMADCAAAPALFYAHTVLPIPDQLQNLHAYFDRLMQRASVRRVIEETKPYFSFYPFADRIPERFR